MLASKDQDLFLERKDLALVLRMMGFIKALNHFCEPVIPTDCRLFEELTKVICLNASQKIHRNDFLQLLIAIQGIRVKRSDYPTFGQKSKCFGKYFDNEVLELTPNDIENLKGKFKQLFMNRIHSSISSGTCSHSKIDRDLTVIYIGQLLQEKLTKELFNSYLQAVLGYYQAEVKIIKSTFAKRGDSQDQEPNFSEEGRKKSGLNRLVRAEASLKSQNSLGSGSRGSQGPKKDDSRDSMKIFRSIQFTPQELPIRNLTERESTHGTSMYYDKAKRQKKLNFSQYLSEDDENETHEIYKAFYGKEFELLERTDIYSKQNTKAKSVLEKDQPLNCIYDVGSKHQSRKADVLEKLLTKSINYSSTNKKNYEAGHRSMTNDPMESHLDFDQLKTVIEKVANEFSKLF